MKPMTLLLIIVTIFMVNSAYAAQYKFIAKDDSIYTKMCVLAGNNEQKALKRILRRHRDSEKSITNSTFCNDMYIANFAQKYNASMTFNYLKRHTYRKNLDKASDITIKDIVTRVTEDNSAEEIILVYVGH
ncbi:DUF3718 domain-containing protein [Thalassotalea fonticola]|uniref:DUF3718 domain-containing protein n=1 Tax=Thalassotalea fonticola TaxID=3065649 RepID=A0ABZ0GMW8_9GAMM|nr:DUF3718 domain-containing protein [Colwelliaceae bacterium S1-1]